MLYLSIESVPLLSFYPFKTFNVFIYHPLIENDTSNVSNLLYFSQVTKNSSPPFCYIGWCFILVDHATCNFPIHALPITVEGSRDRGGGLWVADPATRAGNEPSYSGSTRARLEKSSARAQLVS